MKKYFFKNMVEKMAEYGFFQEKGTEEPGPNVKIALKIMSHLKQF